MRQGKTFRSLVAGIVAIVTMGLGAKAVAAERGGTLTVGLYGDATGFELGKVKSMSQGTIMVAMTVMESLFALDYDRGDAVIPRLGLSFETAPDRMSALVRLRPGVKFHDGSDFNADAVAFHYTRMLDPNLGTGFYQTLLEPLEKVEAVDALTVRFVLKQPWAGLQAALSLDHHMNLIGSPTAVKADPEGFNRKPVGTGPFVFGEWRTGESIVVAKNPDYWDKDLPYLDRVVFRIMLDENTRFQSLRAGELDLAWIENAGNILEARKDSKLQIYENRGAGAGLWLFNHKKKPFDDPRVRAAVVHAFDGEAFASGYYKGTASPSDGFVSRDSFWHCGASKWRGYDLEKAKSLVKEIGTPIRFTVNGYGTPDGRRVNAIMQQFMKSAGIDAQIEAFETSRIFPKILRGEFEMSQFRIPDYGGEPDIPFSHITYRVMGYDNPKMKELIAKARGEPDRAKRKALYCQVSDLLSEDAIQLYPVHNYGYIVGSLAVADMPRIHNQLIRTRTIWLRKQ